MLKEVSITKITRTPKTGKFGPYELITIQMNGKQTWVSGFDNRGETKDWKEGMTILLDIYEKPWVGTDGAVHQGWNFKIPKKVDLLEERVKVLEEKIEQLTNGNLIKSTHSDSESIPEPF